MAFKLKLIYAIKCEYLAPSGNTKVLVENRKHIFYSRPSKRYNSYYEFIQEIGFILIQKKVKPVSYNLYVSIFFLRNITRPRHVLLFDCLYCYILGRGVQPEKGLRKKDNKNQPLKNSLK